MTFTTDWSSVIQEVGPQCASRTAAHDSDDSFVAESFAALKERGLFAAGVPAELGGGGATHPELCEIVRQLAHHCSSTALAFAMHTHLVATLAYVWRSGNPGPETMLRRVAAEKLTLISTGASDWLSGSGKLEKVEGGYRLTGKKIFGSGVPAGDVLMTTGVFDDPVNGPTVFHIPVPLRAEGVKILDTWHVMPMRGTGSHDVQLDGVFIPDAATMGVRRAPGKWHPFMHTVALVALPIVYAAYVGVAEAARTLAVSLASRKKDDPGTAYVVGEMENEVVAAQIAHAGMVELVKTAKPGPETTSAAVCRRTIVANSVLRAVVMPASSACSATRRARGITRSRRKHRHG
jgi:acyl-CoA dehydrogenase